jgi:hypothetical protein
MHEDVNSADRRWCQFNDPIRAIVAHIVMCQDRRSILLLSVGLVQLILTIFCDGRFQYQTKTRQRMYHRESTRTINPIYWRVSTLAGHLLIAF